MATSNVDINLEIEEGWWDEDRISAFEMKELRQLRVSWTEINTSEWALAKLKLHRIFWQPLNKVKLHWTRDAKASIIQRHRDNGEKEEDDEECRVLLILFGLA